MAYKKAGCWFVGGDDLTGFDTSCSCSYHHSLTVTRHSKIDCVNNSMTAKFDNPAVIWNP